MTYSLHTVCIVLYCIVCLLTAPKPNITPCIIDCNVLSFTSKLMITIDVFKSPILKSDYEQNDPLEKESFPMDNSLNFQDG